MPKKPTTNRLETLAELSEAYLAHLKKQGKSDKTLYTYGKDLDEVKDYFGPDKALGALRPADFGRFQKSDALLKLKSGQPKSDITTRKTLRVMRMMLVWAVETGILEKLPLPKDFPMGRDGEQKEAPAVETQKEPAKKTKKAAKKGSTPEVEVEA